MSLQNPSEEFLVRALEEFGTTHERVKQDVQLVKKWLQEQPHLPNVEDEEMIQRMLIRCKCSVERAKQTWDLHFTLKTAMPEFFANRDPLNQDIQAINNVFHHATLSNLTSDGSRVFLSKILKKDTSHIQGESILKLMYMIADIDLLEEKSTGAVFIYDHENITLDFIVKWTFSLMKKIDVTLKGYRIRVKGIHFLNASPGLDILLSVLRSVLKSKLVSRIHVHNNLESLYKHVDRKILPREYGGEGGPLEQLSSEFCAKIDGYRDWFLEQDVIGKADESKRTTKSNINDLFGFEGTFKQLTVD